MSEQNAEKPFQFSLKLLRLITALIAAMVAWLVTVAKTDNTLKNVWQMQNGSEIRERKLWLEDARKSGNKELEQSLQRQIWEFENGVRGPDRPG